MSFIDHRAAVPAGLIGPNAVTQLSAALHHAGLDSAAASVFAAAGASDWLAEPPGEMVDEQRVARLHVAVRATLPAQADAILTEAGRLTADYLLAARIPRPAQAVLRLLPARGAAALLVAAIRAHAWTFAGSGRFRGDAGSPTVLQIFGNPLCAGTRAQGCVCLWHAAVFQRLFAALVAPRARVVETACEARGDGCCRFVVDWRRD